TNYPLSASITSNFSPPSFTVTASGANLTGGQDKVDLQIFDQGSITVGVNSSYTTSINYGKGDTSSNLAKRLADQIQGDKANTLVDAVPSKNVIYLTARTTGSGTNYGLAAASNSTNINFTGTSFPITKSGDA